MAGYTDLPPELIRQIFNSCPTMQSAALLGCTNRFHRSIWKSAGDAIERAILRRHISPQSFALAARLVTLDLATDDIQTALWSHACGLQPTFTIDRPVHEHAILMLDNARFCTELALAIAALPERRSWAHDFEFGFYTVSTWSRFASSRSNRTQIIRHFMALDTWHVLDCAAAAIHIGMAIFGDDFERLAALYENNMPGLAMSTDILMSHSANVSVEDIEFPQGADFRISVLESLAGLCFRIFRFRRHPIHSDLRQRLIALTKSFWEEAELRIDQEDAMIKQLGNRYNDFVLVSVEFLPEHRDSWQSFLSEDPVNDDHNNKDIGEGA